MVCRLLLLLGCAALIATAQPSYYTGNRVVIAHETLGSVEVTLVGAAPVLEVGPGATISLLQLPHAVVGARVTVRDSTVSYIHFNAVVHGGGSITLVNVTLRTGVTFSGPVRDLEALTFTDTTVARGTVQLLQGLSNVSAVSFLRCAVTVGVTVAGGLTFGTLHDVGRILIEDTAIGNVDRSTWATGFWAIGFPSIVVNLRSLVVRRCRTSLFGPVDVHGVFFVRVGGAAVLLEGNSFTVHTTSAVALTAVVTVVSSVSDLAIASVGDSWSHVKTGVAWDGAGTSAVRCRIELNGTRVTALAGSAVVALPAVAREVVIAASRVRVTSQVFQTSDRFVTAAAGACSSCFATVAATAVCSVWNGRPVVSTTAAGFPRMDSHPCTATETVTVPGTHTVTGTAAPTPSPTLPLTISEDESRSISAPLSVSGTDSLGGTRTALPTPSPTPTRSTSHFVGAPPTESAQASASLVPSPTHTSSPTIASPAVSLRTASSRSLARSRTSTREVSPTASTLTVPITATVPIVTPAPATPIPATPIPATPGPDTPVPYTNAPSPNPTASPASSSSLPSISGASSSAGGSGTASRAVPARGAASDLTLGPFSLSYPVAALCVAGLVVILVVVLVAVVCALRAYRRRGVVRLRYVEEDVQLEKDTVELGTPPPERTADTCDTTAT